MCHPGLDNAKFVVVDEDAESATFAGKFEFAAPADIDISGGDFVATGAPVGYRSVDFEVEVRKLLVALLCGKGVCHFAVEVEFDLRTWVRLGRTL
jgi:hypothetical protein